MIPRAANALEALKGGRNMNNCLCGLFDNNNGIWIILIALVLIFCCCG
jgi:hypothetical protein